MKRYSCERPKPSTAKKALFEAKLLKCFLTAIADTATTQRRNDAIPYLKTIRKGTRAADATTQIDAPGTEVSGTG